VVFDNLLCVCNVTWLQSDKTCWCSCTCNGKKLETPVRLRPPEGEEGQQIYAGLMENEERLAELQQQQQQQQQQHQQHEEDQQEQQQEQAPFLEEDEGAVDYDSEGQDTEDVAAAGAADEPQQQQQQQQEELEAGEQVAAPAPSLGVEPLARDEL
jgi:hypothetical protein